MQDNAGQCNACMTARGKATDNRTQDGQQRTVSDLDGLTQRHFLAGMANVFGAMYESDVKEGWQNVQHALT
jgi:hypothetical protein